MIRKYTILSVLTALTLLMTGCTKIPDFSDPNSSDSETSGNTDNNSTVNYNESSVREFLLNRQEFISKLHAESGVSDGAVSDDDSSGEFDGNGYVKLRKENTLTHILLANTAQHYRIILAARSAEGATVRLQVGDTTVGAFYVPARKPDANGVLSFEYSAVDSVYLNPGQNILKLCVTEGSLDLDYILAENTNGAGPECYGVGSACVNPVASLHTVNVMKYLSEIYGNSILTAQNVSPASNAEIDAVYNATGRYPALRSGELAYAISEDKEDLERLEDELELALDWMKNGGLQAYSWHWYSPNYSRSTERLAFNLKGVFDHQRPEDIALMGDSEITALVNGGFMPAEISALLDDIDAMAEILRRFDDANETVIFHPLPDGDSGEYWWGQSPEIYKTLWQIMFDRICLYHKIKSVIWVWDGSDMDYYPGDSRVDIIGQSFYEHSDASFAGRFSAISSLTTARKPLSVTSCNTLPNVDYMFRDNALWLWTAAGSGELTLNSSGALTEEYNSVQYMKYFYNCKSTIALDELPNFNIVI